MKWMVVSLLNAFMLPAACDDSNAGGADADAPDEGESDGREQDAGRDDLIDDLSPAEGTAGSPCGDQADCGGMPALSPMCIQQLSCQTPAPDGAYADVYTTVLFPGGYCSAACTSPAECGPDAQCIEYCSQRLCLASCQRDTDCRVPYHCFSPGEDGGTCLPVSG